MGEVKFTSGPWWYQEKSDAYTHIVRAGENRFLCQLAQDTSGESEANAHLISAAPELYEALIGISEMLWSRPDISDKLRPLMGFAEKAMEEKALAALRKARGLPPFSIQGGG
jgi:hypothetical protein